MASTNHFKKRLLSGIGANAYGQAITIIIQLISVPLYIHYWGLSTYGEWLLISALPAYLSMCDFGIGAVAGNSMVAEMANKNKDKTIEIYQSTSSFNAIISLSILLPLAAIIYFSDPQQLFNIHLLNSSDVKISLLLMTLQILIGLQSSTINAGYRALNRYAEGTFWSNTTRLLEWAFAILALMLGGSIVATAVAYVTGRIIGYSYSYFRLLKIDTEFGFSFKKSSIKTIKSMLKPGLAFLAFPLGLAIGIQGMTIVIGTTLGAIAVANFSILRTVSRILIQVVTVINQATWPEITRSYAAGNLSMARQIHIRGCQFALATGIIGLAFLLEFNELIFRVWLHKALSIPIVTLTILLLSALINICAQSSWVVLMATNKHQKISIAFILAAALSIFTAYLLMPYHGITGAALAVLLSEIIILFFAIKESIFLLKESTTHFLISLLRIKYKE